MTTQNGTRRVVVGVDGSDSSAAALRWAAHYAQATGSTLRAVLAWHYPTAAGVPPVGRTPANVESEVERGRAEVIDKAIAAALGDEPPIPIERKADYGHPVEVLVAESAEADLLVVGSRGHGGFTGMMLGSVSTHCVTHAHCPVTVVRPN
jgi:nucleotide-binding universal stress UspA family protein